MSNKFKTGDRVRRLNYAHFEHQVNSVHTVLRVSGKDLVFSDCSALCAAVNYELVEAAPVDMILSTDAKERKDTPITEGVLDYFPRALAAVARCSKAGNDQHNPGQSLHWDKSKSTDHANCITRHLIDRNAVDTDGIPHAAKLAWRALALLETQIIEQEAKNV